MTGEELVARTLGLEETNGEEFGARTFGPRDLSFAEDFEGESDEDLEDRSDEDFEDGEEFGARTFGLRDLSRAEDFEDESDEDLEDGGDEDFCKGVFRSGVLGCSPATNRRGLKGGIREGKADVAGSMLTGGLGAGASSDP